MILPNKDRLLQDAIQSAVLFLHDKTWRCKDVHGVKVEKWNPETTRCSRDLCVTGSIGAHRECHGKCGFSEEEKKKSGGYVHKCVISFQQGILMNFIIKHYFRNIVCSRL